VPSTSWRSCSLWSRSCTSCSERWRSATSHGSYRN
jgi:hypothetical protein